MVKVNTQNKNEIVLNYKMRVCADVWTDLEMFKNWLESWIYKNQQIHTESGYLLLKLQLWAQQEFTGCVRTCISVRTVPTHSVRTMRIVRTIARTAYVYFIFVIMNFKNKKIFLVKLSRFYKNSLKKKKTTLPCLSERARVRMRARKWGLIGGTILGTRK